MAERQALAMMDHPAIARVYEAGATNQGRPFFAMELVRGTAITEHCDSRRLSIAQRLRLFVEVCQGVQHAHQRGVIHRDIKPSNLIVTEKDGRPTAKIIDFGISRATAQRDAEETVFTRLGQWVGTPEYMSPEQAASGSLDIDTRSDVYSLGVVLYELLTGTLPFDSSALRASGFDEMRRQIREVDPQRPSTRVGTRGAEAGPAAAHRRLEPRVLVRALRGDLDWIVMKAIEKDRSRRYGSPAELAADIERHLAFEPLLAGPPSAVYRLGKLVRRHRLGVGAAALVALALLLGFIGTIAGLRRAEREAGAAMRAADVLAGVFLGLDPTTPGGPAGLVPGILERGELTVDRELAGRPQLQSRVLSALGQARYALGQYAKARGLLGRALALQRRDPQRDTSELLVTLGTLGWLAGWSGSFEEARQRFEEGLSVAEAAAPAHERHRIALHLGLAWLSVRTGDLEEAPRHVDAAARLVESGVAPDDPQRADLLFMDALVLREQRRHETAIRHLERCLAIRERAFGPEHSSVAWAMESLGWNELRLGRTDRARRHLQRALQIDEQTLGPQHRWVAFPVYALGVVELQAGNLEAARRYFDRALEVQERTLGPGHPDVAWTLSRLATLRRLAGDPNGCRSLLERSLRIVEAALPASHPDRTMLLARLARAADETGRRDEARAYLARLAEAAARPEAARHPAHARDLYNLACIAARHGDRARGLEWLAAAVAEGFVDAVVLDDPDWESGRSRTRRHPHRGTPASHRVRPRPGALSVSRRPAHRRRAPGVTEPQRVRGDVARAGLPGRACPRSGGAHGRVVPGDDGGVASVHFDREKRIGRGPPPGGHIRRQQSSEDADRGGNREAPEIDCGDTVDQRLQQTSPGGRQGQAGGNGACEDRRDSSQVRANQAPWTRTEDDADRSGPTVLDHQIGHHRIEPERRRERCHDRQRDDEGCDGSQHARRRAQPVGQVPRQSGNVTRGVLPHELPRCRDHRPGLALGTDDERERSPAPQTCTGDTPAGATFAWDR